MKIQKIIITAEGDLGHIPDVAGLIMSCVKMQTEGRQETGDFYFDKLHVIYSYAEHTKKKGGRKKKEEVDE